MKTEFEFPYGKSVLKARLPQKNIAVVLKSQYVRGLEDPAAAILDDLREPIGMPPLVECVRRGDKVVIIVTDNTRACPDSLILPPLLAEVERKTPSENVTIIVALGLHPPLNRQQLVEKLGQKIVDKYHVINHDASQTVNIGVTSAGVPVEINRCVVEADFRLSTGFIEPHFFAGFSGGGKSIFPGVASPRAIHINHGYKFIDHPASRAGSTEENPVYRDILEQAKMAKLDFIVNVLLNKRHEITHIVCGEPAAAHRAGCKIARDITGVNVARQADITITTNSGAPLDLDLYQTAKGIDNASLVTRNGGIIIIAAACDAGAGPKSFVELHAMNPTPQAVLNKIKLEEPLGVQWQNQILARARLKNDIFLVSCLEESLVRSMMMQPFPTIESALEEALRILGDDARIALIPEGPTVLPVL
jgi:nickel-dependent lactate racemase